MKRRRLLFLTVIAIGWIAAGLCSSLPVQALTIASIGDSYASGEGNPDEPQRFDTLGFVKKGPIWADRQCHRSHIAAPEKSAIAIAGFLNQPLEFIGLACTGARLDHGILEPYDPETDNTHNPLPSQIDALRSRIGNRPIDILMISAGGNDVGFADIIKKCIKMDSLALVRRNNELCSRDPGVLAAIKNELAALPQKYERVADQLKSMQIRQVIITEYPDPTKGANGSYCGENGNSRILFLHPLTAKWAEHEIVIPINAAVGAAAERHGWIRVPVQAWSTTHGYCAGNARWFRTEEDARNIQGPYEIGFSFRDGLPPGFQFSSGSLHPNPAGHDAIARQIVSTTLPIIGTVIGGVPVKEQSRDEIYVVYGGAKFYIPDPPTLKKLFGDNPAIVTVPDGALTQVPLVPRDGTLIKELDDRIHVIYGGAKFYIPDPTTFERLFGERPVVTVPQGALTQVPLVPRDGTLIRELTDGRVHVTYGGARFYIPDPPTLKTLFGDNPSIATVPDGALTQVLAVPRDGTLIKELTDQKIYLIRNGAKYWISTPEQFHELGLSDEAVRTVPNGALATLPDRRDP